MIPAQASNEERDDDVAERPIVIGSQAPKDALSLQSMRHEGMEYLSQAVCPKQYFINFIKNKLFKC